MGALRGLLTGAGISADRPASLPLGREFSDRLRQCCHAAARHVASDVVAALEPAVVAGTQSNLLGRIDACLRAGQHISAQRGNEDAVGLTDVLECFRVVVPNEAHLLAAVHAVRGTLHVSLNFDDGVERAYALLAGEAELPADVPEAYHRALDQWRRVVRPASSLRIVASDFADADYDYRPLLVKLRGSALRGLHASIVSRRPPGPDVDAQRLGDDQLVAVRAVVDTGHLTIAGVSGSDADCRSSLLPLLRAGRFSWTATALPPEIVASIRSVDAEQPVLSPALVGVRASLDGAAMLPPWPQVAVGFPGFDERFGAWCARLPVEAAATAYAWLLADAGLHDQADAILRAASGTDSRSARVRAGGSAEYRP